MNLLKNIYIVLNKIKLIFFIGLIITTLSCQSYTYEYETGLREYFHNELNINNLNTNYYFIQVIERRYVTYTLDDGSDTTFIEDTKLSVYSDDPIAFADDWYMEEGVIFNDEVINGKEYTIWFKGNSYYYDNNESRSVYYIIFKTVSKEFYRYYISLAKHMNAQGEIFMEPVQVYTNIENGFGIFAGYSADADSVIIQN